MRIGVDIGGTKIEAIAISTTGDEIARKRIETPKGDYKGTLEAIRLVVRTVEEKISNSNDHIRPAVGIGIPGSLKRQSNVVQNSNSTWIIGKNIKKDVGINAISSYNRASNITEKVFKGMTGRPDAVLFRTEEEKILFEKINEIRKAFAVKESLSLIHI